MEIRADEISKVLKDQIQHYNKKIEVTETGSVLTIGDGVARVYGLDNAMAGELIEFSNNLYGMVLNLEKNNVGIAILGDYDQVKEGDIVKRTKKIFEVPVGEGMLGRVVDPLGIPMDGKGPIKASANRKVEIKAPGI